MAYCPQRTVQSINKYKQKNAEIRRYDILSGRVISQCCSTDCLSPTADGVTISNLGPTDDPTFDTLFSYTVQYTNGTSFQWFYISQESTTQLSDTPNISGSQTSILLVKTKTTDCPIVIQPSYFLCVVSNNCGSARSGTALAQGCGF